jgi:cation:H+ antiporter
MELLSISFAFSILILVAAVFALVRGADMFVEGAKHVGAAVGMTSFATGVIIAGFGTSFPELASSIAAVMQGETEIVVANVVGSNITNILLVVGLVAERTDNVDLQKEQGRRPKLEAKYIGYVIFGLVAVLVGAHYAIQEVIGLAGNFKVPVGLVSITAIAIGTSLPELFVSLKAAREGHGEFAIGGIYGSNAFNILMVVGIPGLFSELEVGSVVSNLGLGILVAASLIFFVTGLARQIMRWEGLMLVIFFCFFLVKMVDFI